MLDVIKKIIEAAEELGTVKKFSAGDWVNPGEYRVFIEGENEDGLSFQMDVTLKPHDTNSEEKK